MGHAVKRGEVGLHVGLEGDEGALVAHLVAVVGRAEDGDAAAVVRHLVPFGLHLVRPARRGGNKRRKAKGGGGERKASAAEVEARAGRVGPSGQTQRRSPLLAVAVVWAVAQLPD